MILVFSGIGVMEVGMINFLSLGDCVLCGCNGKFGDCWVEVVIVYGF